MQDKFVKRVFKLISGETIIGEATGVDNDGTTEILIKSPYKAIGGNMIPFMLDEIGTHLEEFQIHPINIMISLPMENFPDLFKLYTKETSGIIL